MEPGGCDTNGRSALPPFIRKIFIVNGSYHFPVLTCDTQEVRAWGAPFDTSCRPTDSQGRGGATFVRAVHVVNYLSRHAERHEHGCSQRILYRAGALIGHSPDWPKLDGKPVRRLIMPMRYEIYWTTSKHVQNSSPTPKSAFATRRPAIQI
jgi:hypothetical protein